MSIQIKRVYEDVSDDDGYRVLVDRLWPRGLSKKAARIDLWLRDIAPSNELRQWYQHDPDKWDEFRKRYFRELDGQSDAVQQLANLVQKQRVVTLVYSSKAEAINNAVALKAYLETHHTN